MIDETSLPRWLPLFEFQDYAYQSFLVLPSQEENSAPPGGAIAAKKWAQGAFSCGQAFNSGEGYVLNGNVSFGPGAELSVSAKGALGSGNDPAPFEAIGTGTEGALKGATYKLVGWVFPETPIVQGGGRVVSVRGAVQAVRGTDSKPELDPGGMPLGTVGAFVITAVKGSGDT